MWTSPSARRKAEHSFPLAAPPVSAIREPTALSMNLDASKTSSSPFPSLPQEGERVPKAGGGSSGFRKHKSRRGVLSWLVKPSNHLPRCAAICLLLLMAGIAASLAQAPETEASASGNISASGRIRNPSRGQTQSPTSAGCAARTTCLPTRGTTSRPGWTTTRQ